MKHLKLVKERSGFILLLTLLFASCHSPNTKEEKEVAQRIDTVATIPSKRDLSGIKVGYSSPSLNAPFYVALDVAIQKNVEAYNMEFFSVDGQNDITKQIRGIEDLITRKVDVLVINPLDPKALVPVVNRATKDSIPVFIVDSFIDTDADFSTAVLAANRGNGDLLGEWVAAQLGKTKAKLAVISGAQGNPVGRDKRLGFISGFIDAQLKSLGHTNLDIVSQGWGNWTIGGGLKAMEDILVAHPEINIVVGENDAMAMGALRAIQGSKEHKDVLVVGFDAQKEALKLIKKGELAATAVNSPSELGKLVIQSVVKYLNGEKTMGVVTHTPAILITQSNVDKYYDPNALF